MYHATKTESKIDMYIYNNCSAILFREICVAFCTMGYKITVLHLVSLAQVVS